MKQKLLSFVTALVAALSVSGMICYADVVEPFPELPPKSGSVWLIAAGVIAVIIIAMIILLLVKKSRNKKK